jgi:hypothetical protein
MTTFDIAFGAVILLAVITMLASAYSLKEGYIERAIKLAKVSCYSCFIVAGICVGNAITDSWWYILAAAVWILLGYDTVRDIIRWEAKLEFESCPKERK